MDDEQALALTETELAEDAERDIAPGHNGGPALDEHVPEWGPNGIGNYFDWKRAHRKAWNSASRDVMMFRLDKAQRLGLTYEEYTLEILERGRYLQPEDTERIAKIKRARSRTAIARL